MNAAGTHTSGIRTRTRLITIGGSVAGLLKIIAARFGKHGGDCERRFQAAGKFRPSPCFQVGPALRTGPAYRPPSRLHSMMATWFGKRTAVHRKFGHRASCRMESPHLTRLWPVALPFTWSRWLTIIGGWVWKLVECTSI